MKARKYRIKYKAERAVISDVLPYELPITFSNRHFYSFLLKANVAVKGKLFRWDKSDDAQNHIMRIILGQNVFDKIDILSEKRLGRPVSICQATIKHTNKSKTIPFAFKISHKDSDFRVLSICHPLNQIKLVNFYSEYKELILYYSSISPFSIRKPHRIARFSYHKDKTHKEALADDASSIEEAGREYENVRSFFVYKDYSNVFKFYESKKFYRCEQRFDYLSKLDISKCFDSVYTHSICWALFGKNAAKEILFGDGPGKLKACFPDEFDRLMSDLNYGETNGIIIGPEFSRIFAEIILQAVDVRVFAALEGKAWQYSRQLQGSNYKV